MKLTRCKSMWIILFSLLGAVIPLQMGYAQTDVVISLDDISAIPGDMAPMPVNIDPNGASIGAITFSIFYDATVVSIDSSGCTLNEAFTGACNTPNEGEIKITLISFTGFDAASNLADLSFATTGSGGQSSPLTLSVTTLAGPLGNEITDYTLNDGQISLIGSNGSPTANAGADQTVMDSDNSGSESITLNGGNSTDSDGSISTYTWEGITGVSIPSTATPTVDVPVGSYTVTLTVTDNDGATAMDSVTITVSANDAPPPADGVRIVAGSATLNESETESVGITMEAGDIAVGAATVRLSYDPAIVSVNGCQQSTFGGSCNFETAGIVQITGINPGGASGTSTLATLDFSGQTVGISPFTIEDVETLSSPSGTGLSFATEDGQLTVIESEEPTTCGSLVQEAENGILRGNYTIGQDESASGGAFAHVPLDSPNQGFGNTHVAEYCMTVTAAGDYRIVADVLAATGLSDSAFVTINDVREPAEPDYWQMARNETFEKKYLTSRQTGEVSVLNLTPGNYTIKLHQRDDGVRWDTIGLEVINESTNVPPVANAGADRTVIDSNNDGSEVINLNGFGSNDSDGAIISYVWSGLPNVEIDTTINPTILLPIGSYDLTLTVTDNNGATDSDTVTITIIGAEPPANCGPLSQEAEDGILSGSFILQADEDASNGAYVGAPDRSGDAPAGPDGLNQVSYCVTVPEDGRYRILATAQAPDGGADSFYVALDGEPASGYLWDAPTSASFAESYVSDRRGANPVEVSLTEGNHQLIFSLREDGAKLDKFTLEPVESVEPPIVTCGGLRQEAENGAIFGNFTVGADPNASGGQFISAPTGGEYGGPNALQRVDYCMTVEQAGDYAIAGTILAPNGGSNSFYIKIDDTPVEGVKWTAAVNNAYEPIYVNVPGAGRYVVPLTQGEHTISVFLRENGTQLDTIALELVNTEPPSPSICDGLVREGEEASFGGGFVVGEDAAASNGQFIHVPNGAGSEYEAPNEGRRADLCYTVEQAGQFVLQANVYGENDGNNSFYVRVNDGPESGHKWHIPTNTIYEADYVSSPSADPVILALDAGQHIVSVYLREDGARLDKMTLEPATTELISRSQSPGDTGVEEAQGVHGTIRVQSVSFAEIVDPETVDFSQFSLTLIQSGGSQPAYSATVVPNADGYYRFEAMPVGDYSLSMTLPNGYESTMVSRVSLSLSAERMARYAPDVLQQAAGQVDNGATNRLSDQLFIPFTSRRNFK